MQVKSLRWLCAVVVAPLSAFVLSTTITRAQGGGEQASSPPVAQSSAAAVRGEWETQMARTLVSIQNALRREETPPTTFMTLAVELGRPMVVVAIYVGVLIGLLWAWSRCLRLFPRKGTLVSFEDLTVPRSDRPEKSRILTQLILDLLQNPRPVQMSDLQMDIMPGLKEPGFGNLQPAITMVSVAEYEPSENPMKIGMVEFSIRDLHALFSRYFARPHNQYLEGWLIAEDGGFDAGARLVNYARKPVLRPRRPERSGQSDSHSPRRHTDLTQEPGDDADSPLEWRVRKGGDGARFEAIADLAAQILVDTGNSTLTNSWQSFRCFNRALSLRDDQETPKPRADHQRSGPSTLTAARGHLERAVAHDPSNWIARFSLALTLSRDDEADVALKHLIMLEKVVKRAWSSVRLKRDSEAYHRLRAERPAFCNVVDHLKDYPECAFLILYNKAVALQNVDANRLAESREVRSLEHAANIFAQISRLDEHRDVHLEDPYPEIAKYERLSDRSRVELSLYALSALADLLADAPESLAPPPGLNRSLSRANQIKALLEAVEGLCERKQEEHWRSLQTARAVTLTAHASALEKEGRLSDARDALLSALAAEPRFVKASLRLAEFYLKQTGPTWLLHAKSILEHVLDVNPACEHAAVLLQRLNADPALAAV
jgi:hypothetical protein